MTEAATYVFCDLETTGLPWQEKNQTKITELCLLAVSRKDIERFNVKPPVSKLTFVLNPERKIQTEVEVLTGLTNEYLKNSPTFIQKSNTLVNFIQELPKPVCLVAHNGYNFDYKILLTECNDANIHLPSDLMCVDTLAGFRKLLKVDNDKNVNNTDNFNDNLINNEDMWEELDLTQEDWEEIDKISNSLTNVSCDSENDLDLSNKEEQSYVKGNDKNNTTEKIVKEKTIQDIDRKRNLIMQNVFGDITESQTNSKDTHKEIKRIKKGKSKTEIKVKSHKGQFTLSGLYRKILNKDFKAHRAEDDCFALLECVIAMKHNFLPWIDGACKRFTEIKPLIRK